MTTTTLKVNPFFLNFKRPSDHSKFSPSAADRWLITGCSFSVNFAEHIPNIGSKYSEEGTLGHSLCEAVFRNTFYGLKIPDALLMQVAQLDDQGAEMFDCAHQYVEVVSFWLGNHSVIGDVVHFGLEMGIPVFPDKSCFGTGDCIIIGTKASVVIDFKYGKGKNVKADTLQLKVYAAGIFRYLENVPAGYNIHVVVHQPRTDIHPKESFYPVAELNQFLGVIWESILASEAKDLQPVEGNHCYWCPAKRTPDQRLKCPAILGKPMKLAEENFASFLHDMSAPVMSITAANPKRDAAILKLHAIYPMIKQIVEDTEDEIMMRIAGGEAIHGFFLKDHHGNRTVRGDDDAQRALMIQSKFPQVNPWKEIPATSKLRTLTEIEKEIGKNKLDPICTRKVTKKVEILDERMQAILGDLTSYAQMINNGQGQEE